MLKPFATVLLLPLAAAFLLTTVAAQAPLLSVSTAGVSEQPTASRNGAHPLTPDVLTTEPPPMRPTAASIIRSFITEETQFRASLLQFSFKRDVVLQTIGPANTVTGEYIRHSVFVFDDRGRRIERVVYHPASTIREMAITKEDVQDLAGSQLFGLELDDLSSYNFSYLGEETLDGRAVHVLALGPKQRPDPQHMRARFFVGRIWIDAETFQAVRLAGITEPHGKQRFPAFQTRRELKIENRLFPSTTAADDVLHFAHKDVRYRIDVKYYDFKRFASRLKIVELE